MSHLDIEHCKNAIFRSFKSEYDSTVEIIRPNMNIEEANIRTFLTGKIWKDLTGDNIKNYPGDQSVILSYLGPRLSKIYLPAFMVISLSGPAVADMVFYTTIWRLTPGLQRTASGTDFAIDLHDCLIEEEKISTALFLKTVSILYDSQLVKSSNSKTDPEIALDSLWSRYL